MAGRARAQRQALKAVVQNRDTAVEQRFEASMRLAALPRNGSRTRVKLRCALTGRSKANYRKFKLCRIALRDLASSGQIPGMVKSSW